MIISAHLKKDRDTTLSTYTKAKDIIFQDNEDLQTKFENGQLVGPSSFNGITAVSPKISIVANTDNEFRIKIQSINGTITSPNLKGTSGNQLSDEILSMLDDLSIHLENIQALEESVAQLDEIRNSISKVDSCIVGIEDGPDGLVITRGDNTVDVIPTYTPLSDEDIDSLFYTVS